MSEINSREYWDERFANGSWQMNDGGMQAEYFARLFQKNVPDWLKNYVRDRKLSVLDLGCAQGEGTKVLSEIWSGQVSGADFSADAVAEAGNRYADLRFEVQDALDLHGEWDAIFLSNVLEHFEKPYEVLSKIEAHARHMVIIMVPFEETSDIDEHFVRFTFDDIPLIHNGFTLIYYNDIMDYDKGNAQYVGQQILLVYSKDGELNRRIALKQSSSVLEAWAASQDYVRFKERYYAIDLDYVSATRQIGLLEYQLNEERSHSAGLEQSLRESQARSAELECALQESNDKSAARVNALQLELNSVREQDVRLQEELANEKKKCTDILAELATTKGKYDNLYAYSAKRDEAVSKLQSSKSFRLYTKIIRPPLHYGFLLALKIYRIFIALFTLRFRDLKDEFALPLKALSRYIRGKFEKKKVFADIARDVKGKSVIVFPPTIDWNMPLFQRPQQLALAYSRKDNTIVLYLTKNIQHDNVAVAEKANHGLWLINEQYAERLPILLNQALTTTISISWTLNKKYLDILHPAHFIYEYIDELEIFYGYGPEMETDHQRLMQEADVTICTATKLYNQTLGKAKNPLLSPNAGDYEFFSKTKDTSINPWIRDVVGNYKCVLGYYGALASWFDYELVKTVAQRHPDWLFVLVGINYDGTLDKSEIDQFENIVYVPPQPYKELPSFLTAFDVATIPFVINEITLSTSPVKLFEYMAGGKPILTSKMPECLKYESVRTYADADEFCRIVEEYLAMKPDDPYWDVLKREALENTWDSRTDQILEAIEDQVVGRDKAGA